MALTATTTLSSSAAAAAAAAAFSTKPKTLVFRILAALAMGCGLLMSVRSTTTRSWEKNNNNKGGGAAALRLRQEGRPVPAADGSAAAEALGSLGSSISSARERLDQEGVPDGASPTAEAEEAEAQQAEQQPPRNIDDMNVVLFYADDWTWSNLGFVNKVVKTPNLDAMARNGMSFSHNCVTTSICWQSRATKSTGLYVSMHKQRRLWDMEMFDKTVPWKDTLYPQLFQSGYNVGFFGKWHAQMPPEFQKYTFDHFENYWGEHWMNRNGQRRHVTDLNKEDAINYLRKIRDDVTARTLASPAAANGTTTTANTDATETDSEATAVPNKKTKFALTVSFYATHAWDGQKYPDQYQPMNYSEPLYADTDIPVAPTATSEAWERMPWFFTEDNEGRIRWRARFDTPEHHQESMKRMFRMASEADEVVGAVVQELKDMGVYDNTLLVFTTDNGNFHGEHGLADKWYPHEESIRVPLIIQDPRMPDHLRGTMNDEFTLNIDLAPTLLKAAGITPPRHMQGRDISDLYLGDYEAAAAAWRKDFFYEWGEDNKNGNMWHIPSALALIRKDYKYFYWPQAEYEQLFHVAVDPFEQHDIINTTDPALVAQLKARYFHLKNLSTHGYPV